MRFEIGNIYHNPQLDEYFKIVKITENKEKILRLHYECIFVHESSILPPYLGELFTGCILIDDFAQRGPYVRVDKVRPINNKQFNWENGKWEEIMEIVWS